MELVEHNEGYSQRDLIGHFIDSVSGAEYLQKAIETTRGNKCRDNFEDFIDALRTYSADYHTDVNGFGPFQKKSAHQTPRNLSMTVDFVRRTGVVQSVCRR